MVFLRGAKRFTALLVTGTMLVSSLTGCESEGRAYHAKSNTKGSGDIRAEEFVAIEGGKKVSWPASDKADDNTPDDNAGGESEKGEEEPVVHVKRADIKPSDYGNKDNWMRLPEEVIKQFDTVYLYPLSCTEDTEEACDDSEEDDPEDEYSVPSIPAAYRPIAELDDLDSAVDDLVDSLFDVMDKIASARQFLDKLDSRVTWTLDMLGQLDIPQLSED